MSKLDELIQQYCPDGVMYKTLGELGSFYGGLTGKSKKDFQDGNAVFITYRNVYSNPALDIHPDDRVTIYEGEKQRTLEYGDIIFTGSSETPDECGFSSVVTEEPTEPLYLNSFCFFFRFNDNGIILPDFAKHLFRSDELRYQIGKTASGVTRFNVSKDKMAKVEIPLPALPIQREIVRVLDSFTQYSDELTDKLTAELVARKEQFNFYRDKILLFEEEIEWKPLGEIANIKTGSKPDIIFTDKVENYYEYVNAGTTNSGYVSACNFSGDTVTTPSRGQGGIGFVGYQKKDFWLGPLCYGIRSKSSNLNNQFLYHYLCANNDEILVRKNEGGVPSLNAKDLATIEIPLPPITIQKKVVDVLCDFETIYSDFSSDLPAEIEARQKQYEYYRDKLLTFKRLNS